MSYRLLYECQLLIDWNKYRETNLAITELNLEMSNLIGVQPTHRQINVDFKIDLLYQGILVRNNAFVFRLKLYYAAEYKLI